MHPPPRALRRSAHLLPLLAALTAAPAAQSGDTPFAFTTAELRPLERVVLDLAALGRQEDAAEVRDALAAFGHAEKSLAALDRRLPTVRPVTRGADRQLARATEQLARTIDVLAARLPQCADETRRQELARLVLRIDSRSAPAHRALGHVEHAGQWISAAEHALLGRKAEIQAALQAVRKLSPEIDVAASEHPLLVFAHGHGGQVVSANGIAIHTCWPEAKARRLVTDLLRAVAFSRFLIEGGPIALPTDLRHTSVLFTGKPLYQKALRHDLDTGMTAATWEQHEGLASYYRNDGTLVNDRTTEAHALGGIFSHVASVVGNQLYDKREQPTLIVGHGNWVLMALAGAHLPGISFTVEGGGGLGTAASREDAWQKMLQGAGLMGARSWLREETIAGKDPAWSRSFRPQVGMIQGADMLKTTFVAEYLHLCGPLAKVLAPSRAAAGKGVPEVTAALEQALGAPLAEFEQQWRTWMKGLVVQDGVLDRLGGRAGGLSADDRTVLDYLARVRSAAHQHPWLADLPAVRIDPTLSAHALLHARYLERYPEQAAQWPDAHEEFTDRDGFTPEGCWSGNHSVIAPGVRNATEALDGWMGTFYHRLPLLEPGLLRIGHALAGTTCVLDSGSVVCEVEFAWEVAWPPDGMSDVPRRFQPELPNPFPGEDQGEWGYPITLQLGPRRNAATPEITMTLRTGSADGAEVPCLVSSPQAPGNPLLVPGLVWCLIPKQPLAAGTTYHVRAELRGAELGLGGTTLAWSFRTGR